MACDAGEDQSHLLIIRVLKSIRPVAAARDPITSEDRQTFKAALKDLLDVHGATIVTVNRAPVDPRVDAWMDALLPAHDLPTRSDGVD